jgi:CelD/BcsL family acetyltransferase involved in cellulose biosynthesis
MERAVRIECFEHPDTIDRFLADASAISRKTYQWHLLGLGLRDHESIKAQLALAANRGWFRSYVLYCRDIPASFLLGYQYGGCYYYMDVGYDPRYAQWSVGSVLQLKMLQDLYTRSDRPALFDFSTGYGTHKERFANFSRLEVNVLLFPRTIANGCIAVAYQVSENASARMVRVLDALGIKSRLKQAVRRFFR